jgi:hypothetical protein
MINKTQKKDTIKYNKNIKNIKHIKKQKNYKLKKKTQKLNNNINNTTTQKKQDGGNSNCNITKEDFEVRSLKDFDYDKYKVSNYINANIDWKTMPGPPPQPDCCIL